MGNPSQNEDTGKARSRRNRRHGKPPADGPIADDAGRFTREPAEGGRTDDNAKPTPADGGARGKHVRNH